MRFDRIGRLVIFSILGLAISSCNGIGALPDAPYADSKNAAAIPSGNLISICPASASFQTNAEHSFQDKCVACHDSGSANSLFPLIAGSSLSNDQLNSNYRAALGELLADDGGRFVTNPVLNNPLGNNGHTTIFASQMDPDFIALKQWVSDERATPCSGD